MLQVSSGREVVSSGEAIQHIAAKIGLPLKSDQIDLLTPWATALIKDKFLLSAF